MTDYVVPTFLLQYLFQLKSIHNVVSERERNYGREEQQ